MEKFVPTGFEAWSWRFLLGVRKVHKGSDRRYQSCNSLMQRICDR